MFCHEYHWKEYALLISYLPQFGDILIISDQSEQPSKAKKNVDYCGFKINFTRKFYVHNTTSQTGVKVFLPVNSV